LPVGLFKPRARCLELAGADRSFNVCGAQRVVNGRVLPFVSCLLPIECVLFEAPLQRGEFTGKLAQPYRDLFESAGTGSSAGGVADVGGSRFLPGATQRAQTEAAVARDSGFGQAVIQRAAGDTVEQALQCRG
jgi:hypothetical protein